jgi:hypothetical protein
MYHSAVWYIMTDVSGACYSARTVSLQPSNVARLHAVASRQVPTFGACERGDASLCSNMTLLRQNATAEAEETRNTVFEVTGCHIRAVGVWTSLTRRPINSLMI